MIHASLASIQQPTADDRATTYSAADDGGERYSGSVLVVEAYAAIWLIVAVWLFMLWRKQASLTERLDGLERALDRAAASAEKKAKLAASGEKAG
ncbi:MAG: CcmD family protein [Labilithrix sp.]|nr:CcmD family protein [Labilithrix sp.]